MQEKPSILHIGETDVPLWFDIFILNEVQEKYGSIGVFERKLMGLKEVEENGVKKYARTEPNMEAVLFALPLMILEGYKKMEKLKEPMEQEDVEQVLMDIDIPFTDLANRVHEEFRRCFQAKKAVQAPVEETKKKSRWTLPGFCTSAWQKWATRKAKST